MSATSLAKRAGRGVLTSMRRDGLAATLTRTTAAVISMADSKHLAHATFSIGGRELAYESHSYNRTLRNERAVEIAVARDFLARLGDLRGGPGLEIGNVLRHYGIVGHTVIDKYEPGEGVLNIDVTDAAPEETPSWIVTLSTLEHVGWDESPRTPGKAVAALLHLQSLLGADGRMLVSTPLGWNSGLDAAIAQGLGPAREWFLARTTWRNRWYEIAKPDPADFPYDHVRRSARALWISEWGGADPYRPGTSV